MPETFPNWNEDHSISYLNQTSSYPIKLWYVKALRQSTPYNEGSRCAASAGAFAVMVVLSFNLSKWRLPEQTGNFDANQHGRILSAVYSGESRVLFVA